MAHVSALNGKVFISLYSLTSTNTMISIKWFIILYGHSRVLTMGTNILFSWQCTKWTKNPSSCSKVNLYTFMQSNFIILSSDSILKRGHVFNIFNKGICLEEHFFPFTLLWSEWSFGRFECNRVKRTTFLERIPCPRKHTGSHICISSVLKAFCSKLP